MLGGADVGGCTVYRTPCLCPAGVGKAGSRLPSCWACAGSSRGLVWRGVLGPVCFRAELRLVLLLEHMSGKGRAVYRWAGTCVPFLGM